MRALTIRQRIRLHLEHLEDRSVPTTVTLTGTTLTVLGTPGSEQINVTQSGSTINANGQNFSTSQVQRLVIDAPAGACRIVMKYPSSSFGTNDGGTAR